MEGANLYEECAGEWYPVRGGWNITFEDYQSNVTEKAWIAIAEKDGQFKHATGATLDAARKEIKRLIDLVE